jgi:hypothetical protein
MAHTYLHGAIFECEDCGSEYEDHPQAFAPHLCPPCEEDRDDEDRRTAFGEDDEPTHPIGGAK